MPPLSQPAFAGLLKQYRAAAGLTQEELAEAARLSARAISDLERGVKHRPHPYTVQRLISALGLTGGARAALEAAAHGLAAATAEPVTPATPRMMALRALPTPLVGRARELALVQDLLQHARLVTLTGPGGVGKTRLALEVAAEAGGAFPEGVVTVDLTPLGDAALVLPTVARALGLSQEDSGDVVAGLAAHLGETRRLLVLDNFEHLLSAAGVVADLLAACANLCLLVTSRAALHLRGEHEVAVAPLTLPPEQEARLQASPETLVAYPAVDLFVQRARAVRADWTLTTANAATVTAICRRVDGLPLAIELAAAHLKVLSAPALLARLDHRFPVLAGGARDLPARQQTLRHTLDWSYGLLEPAVQRMFRHLCVFVGGCTLEAAAAIATGEEPAAPDDGACLEVVSTLVDHSLLRAETLEDEEPRFQMLETIRDYGLHRLVESGEETGLRRAHAIYMVDIAERIEPALMATGQAAALQRDHANIRAALRWLHDTGEVALGLRLAGALWRFWEMQGYIDEGRRWLDGLLAANSATAACVPLLVRAKAIKTAGVLAYRQQAYDRAAQFFTEALTLHQELADDEGVASLLNNLSLVAYAIGDLAQATAQGAESLALYRRLGNERGISIALNNLGAFASEQGDLTRAITLHEESLALKRARGDASGMAYSLNNLATLATDQGDYVRAHVLVHEAIVLNLHVGDRGAIADCLATMASAVAGQGHTWQAVRLFSAMRALLESLCISQPTPSRAANDQAIAVARAALTGEAFTAAWAEGEHLTPEQIVAEDGAWREA